MKSILLVPLLFLAPHGPQEGGDPPKGRTLGACCIGDGADCVFGEAGSCTAYCPGGQGCTCKSAVCFLGFPKAAVCKCNG
jgi:hypothetical protein